LAGEENMKIVANITGRHKESASLSIATSIRLTDMREYRRTWREANRSCLVG
jgi:hypothetical protein